MEEQKTRWWNKIQNGGIIKMEEQITRWWNKRQNGGTNKMEEQTRWRNRKQYRGR